MKTYQALRLEASRKAKFWFITTAARIWMTNILLFIVLVSNMGCGITESSTSKTQVKKSFEEIMKDYSKELRFVEELTLETKIKQITGTITPLLEIKPKVWYRNIEIGSYNVVEATVVNPHKYYVITDISLQAPNDLEITGRNRKMILMAPDTRKTLYWIVKPTMDIEKRMIVVCPIDVVSSRNSSSSVKFNIAETKGYPKHSFERLENAVKRKNMNEL